MIKFNLGVTINRPIEPVFAFVTDGQNASKWNRDLLDVQILSEGPIHVGTQYKMTHQLPQGRLENIYEVVAYVPYHTLAMQIVEGPLSLFYRYCFEEVGQQTRVTLMAEAHPQGLAKMLASALAPTIEKRLNENLATLKQLLET